MYCRYCGAEVSEKAIFCPTCGVHPLNDSKFCQECGKPTVEKQEICTSCGVQLIHTTSYVLPSFPAKRPGTAAVLNLFPGLGQLYLGQITKGISLFLAWSVLSIVSAGMLSLPLWITIGIDAYLVGRKLARGQAVGFWNSSNDNNNHY